LSWLMMFSLGEPDTSAITQVRIRSLAPKQSSDATPRIGIQRPPTYL
jgi:hypothetical protein